MIYRISKLLNLIIASPERIHNRWRVYFVLQNVVTAASITYIAVRVLNTYQVRGV